MGQRVYISSHRKERAMDLKEKLAVLGHSVVSTWHDGECKRTRDRDERDLASGAERNLQQIEEDATLVLADYGPGACGGVDFEAGAAVGMGVLVVAVGHVMLGDTRRNNLLFHPLVKVATDDTLSTVLEEIEPEDDFDEFEDFDDDDDDDDDDDEEDNEFDDDEL